MYTDVSNRFREELAKEGRTFIADILQDGVSVSPIIKSIKYNAGSNSDKYITLGSALCAYVEVELYKPDFYMLGNEYQVKVGMNIDGTTEYVNLGYFTAEKPVFDGEDVKVTMYDRMRKFERVYSSSLSYPATISAVAGEICNICGVPMVSFSSPIEIGARPEGYSCREMLTYIGQLLGKFAIINRSGSLEFKWYTDSGFSIGTRYWDPFERSESNYLFHRIEVITGKENDTNGQSVDKKVSHGTGTKGIVFENPFFNQDICDNVYAQLDEFTFRPASIGSAPGDPRLEPGDIITAGASDGSTYSIPVMSLSLEFSGGLTMSISAVGEEEMKDDFSVQGPSISRAARTAIELLLTNRAFINKLDAYEAAITYATITNLEATNANIGRLEASFGEFQTLVASDFTADRARIDTLEANYANVTLAHINDLEADFARIATLVTGNAAITSESVIQLNASNATIDTAFLKQLIAANIAVSDLHAGTIYTDVQRIQSRDGTLDLSGSTMQIRDGNDTVRVQIGKDASDDYNLYLWNENGDLIWNASGITSDGIPNGLIVDDMVAEASGNYHGIGASKLNISSVIGGINTEGGLRSTAIMLDEQNQTLEVAFNQLKSDVDSIEIGGRNLILGTLYPDVSQAKNIPHLIDQAGSTDLTANAVKSTAEHGFRVTNSRASQVFVRFGTAVLNNCTMNGLEAGQTYTLSFDATYKLYGADAYPGTVRRFTAYIYGVKSGSSSFSVDPDCTKVLETFGEDDKGVEKTGRCEYTFTLAEDLTKFYMYLAADNTTTSNFGVDDFVELRNLKLEKGNTATDWTPAPEDYEQVSVGGRNLIVGTLTPNVTSASKYPHINGQTANTSLVSGTQAYTASHGIRVEINSARYANIKMGTSTFSSGTMNGLTAGETYTLSFDASWKMFSNYAGSSTCTLASRVYYAGEGASSFSLLDSKVYASIGSDGAGELSSGRCEHTFTIPADATKIYVSLGDNVFGYCSAGDYIELRNLKLEKGNKATDWTPAPEDFTERIESMETQFTVEQGRIASLISKTGIESMVDGSASIYSQLSTVEQTVAGITAQMSNMYTKTDVDGKITNVNSQLAAYGATIDGLAADLSNTTAKINNLRVGARNLIKNTLNPDVSTNANLPRLVGQTSDTSTSGNSTKYVSEHGFKVQVNSNTMPFIRFGTTTYANATMNGLTAGETYTLSFDACWRLYSGDSTSSDRTFAAYLYDNRNGATSFQNNSSMRSIIGTITSDDKGTEMSGRCEFTFTLPDDVTKLKFEIKPASTTTSYFPAGDYIELRNLKLEKGTMATDWTPAPEDTDEAIDVVNTRYANMSLSLEGFNTRIGEVETSLSNDYWSATRTQSEINQAKDAIELSVSTNYSAKTDTVTSVVIEYALGTSATTAPASGWSTSSPTWESGKFIWQRTAITKNGSTTYSNTACIQGAAGDAESVSQVTNYYLATNASSGVTRSTSGWTTTVQTMDGTHQYLWTYEVVTGSKGSTLNTTEPVIIGRYGKDGEAAAEGRGIDHIDEHYAVSASNTTAPTSWSNTMVNTTTTDKYLWNYETITYTDGATEDSTKRVIGTHGATGPAGAAGADGNGINSISIMYGTSASSSVQPTSWQSSVPAVADGYYLWTRTITDYTDPNFEDTVSYSYVRQGTDGEDGQDGEAGAPGTSVRVSSIEYQAGSSATTAPTGTWASSPVTVPEGDYLWTKTTFSDNSVAYGVAKQGRSGTNGLNVATVYLYQRAINTPSKPTSALTYTFATGALSGTLGNWTQSIPAGDNPCYMILATASASTATDSIPASEWTAPVQLVANGRDGANGVNGTNGANGRDGVDGYNHAIVYLYQRAAAAPQKPSSVVTFEFSSGGLGTVPSGWSQTIPTADGNPCYVTTATAISQEAEVSIAASSWSDVVKLAEDGQDGTSFDWNLITGTLNPDVSAAANYPKLIGQTANTAKSTGTISTAEHGVRVVSTSAARPYIRFGASSAASGSLNGLLPGETYTLSFDAFWKALSSDTGKANATTYYMRAYLYDDKTTAGTFASDKYFNFGTVRQADKGTDMSGRCEFTFTVPDNATILYLIVCCNLSTASHYAAGDYLELRNLRLEKGGTATEWGPAYDELQGEQGVSITNVRAQYALSSSTSAVPADADFSFAPPEWIEGSVLWTRNYIDYSDGTYSTTTPVYDQIQTETQAWITRAKIKITDESIESTVKKFAGSQSSNLLILDDLVASSATLEREETGYSISVASSANYGGVYIPSSAFEASTQYVLSYKFRKESGTLENIGWAGSNGRFTFDKFIVDGTEVTGNPYTMSNDTGTHTAVVVFKSQASLDAFHIQANRGSTTAVTVKYWDLQLEKGTVASLWSPNIEDTTAVTASMIRQTADALEVYADNVRLKATTLVWTAANSSMTEAGKLTINSADIGGIHVTGNSIYSGTHSAHNSNTTGFFLGSDGKLGIGNTASHLWYNNSELELKGTLISTTGTIGGVRLANNGLYARSSSTGITTAIGSDGRFEIFQERTESAVIDPDTKAIIFPSSSSTRTILHAGTNGITTHAINGDALWIGYLPDWVEDDSLYDEDDYFKVTSSAVTAYKNFIGQLTSEIPDCHSKFHTPHSGAWM